MRPVPVPDDIELPPDAQVTVIAPPGYDMLGPVRAVEAIVTPSDIYPNAARYSVIIELDEDDRRAAADGLPILLTFEGGMAPWSIAFADHVEGVPS